MASITSLSNSSYNTSSIYGNRNILSGLASGMDTEQMIENAVSGIKLKIQNLTKKRTKIEWQQEAYRSIIDKAVSLNQKYTSYASKTNLMSNSFFTNAVNTTTLGTYKDKISASGKTSSDIKINAVKQLATAASYTVSGLGGAGNVGQIAGETVDLGGETTLSGISGSMTLKYGGTNGTEFELDFGELEDISQVKVKDADGNVKDDATDAEKLAQAINNKLAEQKYTSTKYGFSEVMSADKVIKAEVKDGKITFSDQLGNGNSVTVGYTSGKLKDAISLDDDNLGFNLTYDAKLTENVNTKEYLSGKTLKFTYNGKSKEITLGDYDENTTADTVVNEIQTQLDEAFGKDKVLVKNDASDGKLALNITAKEQGATLSISGEGTAALGLGEDGKANYVDTGKKLKDLLGDKAASIFQNGSRMKAVGDVDEEKGTDSAGNKVVKGEDGEFYRVDNDGKFLYDFKINGASIPVTEDTTLESLMNSINSNAQAGVKVSYSKMTNEFKFTAAETGANSKVEFGKGLASDLFGPSSDVEPNDNFSDNYGFGWLDDGKSEEITVKFDKFDIQMTIDKNTTMTEFAQKLKDGSLGTLDASYNVETGQLTVTDKDSGVEQEFSIFDSSDLSYERRIEPLVNYTAGRDAVMDVTVNGKEFKNLTRSSNTFEIDGLNITAKGTFNVDGSNAPDKDGNDYEPVTFQTSTDSDKIVDAIRQFVDDYNEMATELKNAYSTMPAQKTNGARYEPLTAEQEDQYSESELKAYNEKAKQGILFGDTTLSSMYRKLLNAIQPGGTDGQTLREIGIGTSYSGGMTTLSLDEDKLRAALDSDPDKVRNAFTKTKESGSATDGLMKTMQNTLDTYVKTTGEPKGVLITRAGSIKAPTSLNSNSLKSQMDSIDNQIDRWTDKMADQIDRYTSKFSKLEQLIAEMNSQSSALMGLMGGGSSY